MLVHEGGPAPDPQEPEKQKELEMEKRTFEPYRLPDGSVVNVDSSVSRGQRVITYQLKGGEVVRAMLVLSPLTLVHRIDRTPFACEGGALGMNLDWLDLKRWIEAGAPKELSHE